MQKRILVLLASTLFVSLSAFADTVATQWQISAGGGEFAYTGGSAPLIATNVPILSVVGLNTPNQNGVAFTVENGLMNLTSGASVGDWKWSSGGSLTVYGCVDGITGNGVNNACTSSDNTLLVSGIFLNVKIASEDDGLGIELGGITGTVSAAIASYFGISDVFSAPLSKVSDQLQGLPTVGGDFNDGVGTAFGGVTSSSPGGNLFLATVPGTSGAVTVPENWGASSTMGLFALGLVVLGVARRRGLINSI